ncbi:MAG TPA: hypothetical protein PKO36_05240 [Candidatus Hydrogenedentes bacterium]|nr:hypothetical protein [Candidatus Hydrogenedentota bacterium]HOV73998.1 hypothetical protein [Candidatus Hydrogenedentota bacterium]
MSVLRFFSAALILAGLVSCGGSQAPKTVVQTREAPASPRPSLAEMPVKERLFGPQTRQPGMDHGESRPEPQFEWAAPDAWKPKAGSSMRLANFSIGDGNEAECYATLLHGTGGGIEANVNRWRSQMGQPPLTAEEIAALPKVNVLGKASPFVEVSGAYTDMAGVEHGNALMYALIVELDGETLFVKMTGPENLLRAEKDHFTAFCQSLKKKESSP